MLKLVISLLWLKKCLKKYTIREKNKFVRKYNELIKEEDYQNNVKIGYNYNKIVSYKYDSWGKILSVKDQEGNEITNPNHIGIMNPFRYRSYYYDEETNLYYLNSRYYNPEWGRFLNADGIIGANMDIIYMPMLVIIVLIMLKLMGNGLFH